MNTKDKVNILIATVLAIGIALHGGIYRFDTPTNSFNKALRFNKFTGSVDLCSRNHGCKSFND